MLQFYLISAEEEGGGSGANAEMQSETSGQRVLGDSH